MKNVLIINGHQPYPFSKGELNRTFVSKAQKHFETNGYGVQLTEVAKGWDVDEEIARLQRADLIFMQFPVNWMGNPWSLKKYMDEVYSMGMDGRLCQGDGRHGPDDTNLYGLGGSLGGTSYMLSVTLNAPKAAFENPDASFFEGRSLDDLLWPTHLNMKFFGASPLPTFAAHDVMKNPNVVSDFQRFEASRRPLPNGLA